MVLHKWLKPTLNHSSLIYEGFPLPIRQIKKEGQYMVCRPAPPSVKPVLRHHAGIVAPAPRKHQGIGKE